MSVNQPAPLSVWVCSIVDVPLPSPYVFYVVNLPRNIGNLVRRFPVIEAPSITVIVPVVKESRTSRRLLKVSVFVFF